MDFSLDYPLFPSVNFFKITSSSYTISKVRHIRILKNLQIRFPAIEIHEYIKIWIINLSSNFDIFFPLHINNQLKKFQKIWPKRKKVILHSLWNLAFKLQKIEQSSYHSNAYFVSIFLYMHIKHLHIFPESTQIALFQVSSVQILLQADVSWKA